MTISLEAKRLHVRHPGIDRDALRARVLSVPKREELVQIQLNEQLIVELYSK